MSIWWGRVALLAVFFGLWEVLPRIGVLDPFFVSMPSRIGEVLVSWVASGQLAPHMLITLEEAVLGFLIGAALGMAAGLLCALVPPVSQAIFPLIAVGNSLPKLAFAPLLIGWFGFGPPSKVALAAAVVFFFIFFSVYSGIRSIDRSVVANARILGGSGPQLLWHIYFPSAISWIVSGVRLAVAYAFAAAVVGEYLGGSQGLGYLIVFGMEMLDLTQVFAGIVVVVIVVGIIDAALRHVERLGTRWRAGAAGEEVRM